MVRRVDRKQQAGKPIPIFLRCEGAISPMFVYHHMDVADLKLELAERTGVPAQHQVLSFSGRQLQTGFAALQLVPGGTVNLIYRLCGGQGTETIKITVQPRVQKDKWSMYWKESMATKTDSLESVTVEVDVNTTIAELQQQLAQKLGWQPADTLTRLQGFTDPWEFAVCQGRSVNLGATLTANGIMTDAAITIVRRVLVPEAWKDITDMQNAAEDSSSEEEGF